MHVHIEKISFPLGPDELDESAVGIADHGQPAQAHFADYRRSTAAVQAGSGDDGFAPSGARPRFPDHP